MAPLIVDPSPGDLTAKLKEACRMFEGASGIHLTVRTRAGRAIKKDAKAEPFRNKEAGRKNCFCCSSGNPGGCERNSIGYQIRCEACHLAGAGGSSSRPAGAGGPERRQRQRFKGS